MELEPQGIVADHPADHCVVGGRGFRAEEQAVRLEREIESVAHHTRLHADAAPRGVDPRDAVQMPTDADYNAAANDLAGERCARGVGNQPDAVRRGEFN
jgi:hypothetical protein